MIKVLVAEDSPVVREFLVHVLESDPDVRVVATATNGEEAVQAVARAKPDVVTMDIHMPGVDGFAATRRIMESHPTPIVIVSGSSDPHEVATNFHAVEAGALAVVPRPKGIGHPQHQTTAQELVRTVKLMSEVRVVRRWARVNSASPIPSSGQVSVQRPAAKVLAVAVGASTGGPMAMQTIFCGLPSDFRAPLLVVQHMSPGFVQGFVEWLGHTTGFSVGMACQGERIRAGRAYVAPDGFQMGVAMDGRIFLAEEPPGNGLRPSISYLFRSVAKAFGRSAVGVLLTGMGKDGAEELKLMRQLGAVTFAQDEESSVVYGMPGEALKLDAATYVLPPEKIAAALRSLVGQEKPSEKQPG